MDDTGSDATTGVDPEATDDAGERVDSGDTFGVGIHVTETELQFVVHVPSSIDSGWTDPETFQALVEQVVWTHLEQEPTLRTISTSASTGDTVTLGTVTLRPDGTVVDHTLSPPRTTATAEPNADSELPDDG